MDTLKKYVDSFNATDEECYRNDIDNAHAYEWLSREIPFFECPDPDIERTYYFRFWTFRKHLKSTPRGYIVTEFLPKVPWSGEENFINAPIAHHLREGRWLRHAPRYLGEYIRFLLTTDPAESHKYSAPFLDSVIAFSRVTGCYALGDDFLKLALRYDRYWDKTHLHPSGLYWSLDNYDAMEYSISGTTPDFRIRRGLRPTLNSYLCADAAAIAEYAELAGERAIAEAYRKKHARLAYLINSRLFEDGFYRAFHYEAGEENADYFRARKSGSPRELIGYIPFIYGIPEEGREEAFTLLGDERVFLTPIGLSTVEQNAERFLYEVDHECLWNGYVWPFATSQVLSALINVMQSYPRGERFAPLFTRLLHDYALQHRCTKEDGTVVPWIDEVRHPYRDEWTSRSILQGRGWEPGGYERGKDYNHSTFCDLVISGLCGVRVCNGEVSASPAVPQDWDYFRLSRLTVCGKSYTVLFDKTGKKYGMGKGVHILPEE